MLVETKHGPVVEVLLNHPTILPVYKKVRNYERHPKEGPPVALLSGGSGAKRLSETLIRYTHSSTHILPVFDDGGSSRELRMKLGMPPPGDLRNRLMALSDMTRSGNPDVSRLFRARLSTEDEPQELERALHAFLDDAHPQVRRIERRYRRIILNHLDRFVQQKPAGFDLRGGNIGNFVIAGAYLDVMDLESVIFEFSVLAAVRGEVVPVCHGPNFHLKAELESGEVWIGQSQITSQPHARIRRLSIVEQGDDGEYREVQPRVNPLARRSIRKSALISYTMGSLYTSIIPTLLVQGVGQAIRLTKRPKVLVANLVQDHETSTMTVSEMLRELLRYLRLSDSEPGEMQDYIHYVLVGMHGDTSLGGRLPVDLGQIRHLGVEPIVLPLEDAKIPGEHNTELVTATLLSLC